MRFTVAGLFAGLSLLSHRQAHAGQISSELNNRCIEVSTVYGTADNAPVQMYTCYNFDHFQLDAVASGMGDYFQLKFRHSDKCVGVLAGSQSVGAAIVQEPCGSGIDSQLWRLQNGKQLMVKHSGNCMTIPGMRTENAVQLQQWPCASGVASNYWNLMSLDIMTDSPPAQPVEESYTQIVSTASNKCAEMSAGRSGNDLALTQYTCYPEDHYQYTFVAKGGGYYNIQFRHSGKCVEVRGGSGANGTPIVQNQCQDGKDSQLWKVTGPDQSQSIVNKATGKCFTLQDGSSKNGTPILQAACSNATSGQTWKLTEIESKTFKEPLVDAYQQIISQENGLCLDVPQATKASDVPVTQYRCLDEDHFSFDFYSKGDYYQLKFKHSGKCVSVLGGSSAENAPIAQVDCEPEGQDDSQLWMMRGPKGKQQLVVKSTGMCMNLSHGNLQGSSAQVVQSDCSGASFWNFKSLEPIQKSDYLVGRVIQIKSKHSDNCAEMPTASVATGAGAAQYRCLDMDHFRFLVQPKGDYYNIIYRHSDKCLDVRGNSQANGVQLEQNPCADGDDAQLWKFVGQPGNHQIINKLTDKCMNIEGQSKKNGAKIVQSTCSEGATSMRWNLEGLEIDEPVPMVMLSMNYYSVVSVRDNKCLEVGAASSNDDHPVAQYSCGNGNHHKLYFVQVGDYYQIKFVHSGKCIDIRDQSEGEGAVVVQETCEDGVDSQLYQVRGISGRQQLVAKHSEMCLNLEPGGNGATLTQYRCMDSLSNYWDLKELGPINNVPPPPITPDTPPPPPPLPPITPGVSVSRWEGPYKMSIIPVAVANLPDGRLLTWSTNTRIGGSSPSSKTWTYVAFYDPTNNKSTEAFIEETDHDMWCPGTSILPDGRIVITGGNRASVVTIYDPHKNTWTRGPDLKIGRGYHGQTMTPEGHMFTLGGSFSGGRNGGKDGELWNPSTSGWTVKSNIKAEGSLLTKDHEGIYRSDNHMWLFAAPNGKIFHAGPSKQTHWLTMGGKGSVKKSVERDSDAMCGNAVMFDIGKLLVLGGAPSYNNRNAIDHAHIIDLNNGDNVKIERIGNLKNKRGLPNSIVLPSGEVVVVGGQKSVKLFKDSTAVMTAEIWSPVTKKFTELAVMAVPRVYHSSAILMKDGRVWAGGGGQCGSCSTNHFDAEILTPPYLFDAQGNLATRPVIQSASSGTKAGGVISVKMNKAAPHSFAVVRLGAVTHTTNNDGRRFPLQVVSQNGATFQLKIPSNKSVALLGSYFLFAMNANGVPSVATILKIDV